MVLHFEICFSLLRSLQKKAQESTNLQFKKNKTKPFGAFYKKDMIQNTKSLGFFWNEGKGVEADNFSSSVFYYIHLRK